jgi:hypothetical protein
MGASPADGGFLVLNDAQLDSLDLLCRIKGEHPRTRLYAQKSLSREAQRVMSIANGHPQATGMLGYHMRRNDDGRGALRLAMDKIKARV